MRKLPIVVWCENRPQGALGSSIRLPPITPPTQHLTILLDGLATLAPRGYVVGLHLFKPKLLATHRAHPVLTGIGGQLLAVGEGTYGEVTLVASEDVGVDTALLGHVVVE